MGRLKQVTLSQQQYFVINLVRFLNFNLKNSARIGTILPKWLISLKICWFYLEDAIKVKQRCKTFIQSLRYLSIMLNLWVLLPL